MTNDSLNLTLKKFIRGIQKMPIGVMIGNRKMLLLAFADDLNCLSSSLIDTKTTSKALEQASNRVGLKINRENTKIIKLLEYDNSVNNDNNEELAIKKLNKF